MAAEQHEVEEFFSNFIGRGRVREAINALLAAREFQFTRIGPRTMLCITPPKPTVAAPRKLVRPGQPIARRPRRNVAPQPTATPKPDNVVPISPQSGVRNPEQQANSEKERASNE